MSDLEHFANDPENLLPDLLKIGIIHYQFETIHPFLDGNGRVGRLMITLYLVDRGILKRPVLYLSDFLERNRQLYYDNLSGARSANGLTQWLKFFLTGIVETAEKGVSTFDGILLLDRSLPTRLSALGSRLADGLTLMQHLYKQPVVDIKEVAKVIKKSDATAFRLVEQLQQTGLLQEITGNSRNRLYAFQEYIDLFA